MARSTERRRPWPILRAIAVLLCLSLGLAPRAPAEDGALRVYEAVLDRYAAAIQPLTLTRTWSFLLWILAANPLLFGIPTPVPIPYSCAATASVTGLHFDIIPAAVSVSGSASGTVCGLPYTSRLQSNVAVSVDPASRRLTLRPTGAMTVSGRVRILGIDVAAPFGSVSVVPSLSAISVPLAAVPFELDTPAGPRTLELVMHNHQLSLHGGYLEIKADAFVR